jgi:hypothetical protein
MNNWICSFEDNINIEDSSFNIDTFFDIPQSLNLSTSLSLLDVEKKPT